MVYHIDLDDSSWGLCPLGVFFYLSFIKMQITYIIKSTILGIHYSCDISYTHEKLEDKQMTTRGIEIKANNFKTFADVLTKAGISLEDMKGMRAKHFTGNMWFIRFTVNPQMFWKIRPVLEQSNIKYRLFDTDCVENVDFGLHPLEGTD